MVSPRLRPYLTNVAIACVLAAASFAVLHSLYRVGPLQKKLIVAYFGGDAGLHHALVIWWLASVPMIAALVVRHRWPLVALGMASFGAERHLLDPRFGPQALDLAVPIVLFSVATMVRARWIWAVALAALVTGDFVTNRFVQSVPDDGQPRLATMLSLATNDRVIAPLTTAADKSFGAVLVLVLAAAIGDSVRSRRMLLATMRQHADDVRREQEQQVALAEAAERARISRELHDIVGHSLSVIVIQAQGAAAALENHPARAATGLAQVITTGRASLAEMRRLLGLVRQGPGGDVPATPEPGVGALAALVEEVGTAGLAVRFRVHGDPVTLPATVDLSAYRIVQEALTNALKHAGEGAQVQVSIRFTTDTVEVEVADDGRGPTSGSTGVGQGLRGIAERVHLLGGELTVGPAGGAGFRIRARLPIGAAT